VTTTAVNLAIVLAQGGERVVLVDADLRRASVATRLGLEGAVGLSGVITRRTPLDHALQSWGDLLSVLPSGQLPPNPSELVGSQSMAGVLEDLRGLFDVVVVDAPPVLPVTDAVVLGTQADGVVLVCRAGQTDRQHLAEARHRVDAVGGAVVGVVLNAVKPSAAQGYYAGYATVTAEARR
jgi:polysaccharide biosynthesis transport protein